MAATSDSWQDKATRICCHLRRTKLYLDIRKDLRELVSRSNEPSSDLKKIILARLKNEGWSTKIQNVVFLEMKRYRDIEVCPANSKEPITFLQKAQVAWEKKVLKSINSMCTELTLPLARKRSMSDQAEISSKFTTIGSECNMAVLSKVRPVYSTLDFMEAVTALQNPNYSPLRETPSYIKGWGQIQVQLKVKSLQELRCFFKEIENCGSQYGSFDTESNAKDMYDNDWYKLGKRVIKQGSCPAAQQYARSGCPTGLRRNIWSLILDVGDQEENKVYFEQLKSYVYKYDLLVDTLVKKDIKSTATNDDQYFVFEDLLYQVLLVFTRDTKVLKQFDRISASPPKSYIRGKLGVEEFAVFYPPNGVIPFHGFSMYAAPLCYVFENPSRLYHTFRELYMRYFSRLHCISSHPQGIVSLCLLFETLLQTQEPNLLYHLRQIGVHPLKTAFNWIFYAFSGYLESEQVLILWDRILGYDSLEVLADRILTSILARVEELSDALSPSTSGTSSVGEEVSQLFDRRRQVTENAQPNIAPATSQTQGRSLNRNVQRLILAQSIFAFRGKNLFGVTSPEAAEAILTDITDIKVVPLLQRSLFLR